jgi:PhnB protein
MAVKPIPEGFHTITPYIMIKDASKLAEFIKKAFDGKEIEIVRTPDGAIMNAQFKIGDSIIMFAEAMGNIPALPAGIYMYVEDADSVYKKAVAAGGVSTMEPADMFYGDRSGGVKDPCGNYWWFATHIEDVPAEELNNRMEAMMKK